MSFMNSWCERLFLFSTIVLISIVLADYKFYFLPINGLWLLLYILCLIISTIWFTCVNIQKLLQQTIPFEYNLESFKYYKSLESIYKFISNALYSVDSKLLEKKTLKNGSHTPETVPFNFLDSQPLIPTTGSPIIYPNQEKSIDERIDILVNDIEQKFISKWYNLISSEGTFPSESKILLEGIIRRILQVSVQIDSSKLLCGALVILLKHLKEFRRARKRIQKNGGSIEAVYRYSHIGNKSESNLEDFTHKLTANVLREFISWELWNSLPCRLLVSVLSKRLTTYLIFYVSQPGWLNYKLLYNSASKTDLINLNLDKYLYISLSDVDLSDKITISKNEEAEVEVVKIKENESEKSISCTPQLSPKKDLNILQITNPDENTDAKENNSAKIDPVIRTDSESVIEKALTKMIAQQTAPILQRAAKSPIPENSLSESSPEKKLQSPFKPVRSEPVKIHSAKYAGKKWDESELSNVSLGQDLLALEALEGSGGLQGFSGRRLWGYNADINEELEKQNPSWEVLEAFPKDKDKSLDKEKVSEVKETSEESKKRSPPSFTHSLRPSTTSASAFVTNTIRPIAGNVTATTLHNMRELQQSTVNNVVRPVSNATEKAMHKIGDLQDEAVGVVEGIFDFGMAGLRKGLRLTGLQDVNESMAKNSKHLIHESTKQSPKNVPKLVKLGHVTSQTEDSKLKPKDEGESVWINPIAKEESPNGFENQMLLEKSPNLIEFEAVETIPEVDITDSNLFLVDSPEYEETADLASTISKLRSLLQQKSSESSLNTPAVSPMLLDDKSCPTPTEPTITDITKGDGGMQRFARTVTGMFNTFKTALPGNVAEHSKRNSEQWIFVENETSETDLPSLLNSLLVERRDYCTVDTAYEAMDSLDLLTESVNSQISKILWESQIYEDELDDLDTSVPITKALFDVICESLQDTNCALNQEPVMKALLILMGSKTEKKLSLYSEKILRFINKLIGPLPKNEHDNVMALNLEKIVVIIEKSFPCIVKEIFGHDDTKTGLKFLISSLQSSKINQDIMLQFFELVCSQLIFASSQMSPTPSA